MKITVFTPTYNRAYTIEKLYRSLQRQEFTDFEWLVIDDGSSDETEVLFQKWKSEDNEFDIRYYKVSNGGKCRAINKALELAKGELFFTVDSDDYLIDDALQKINTWEIDLPKNQKYCGFAGNLGISYDETPNSILEEDYYDGTALDRYGRVDGERAMVFYTEIHRKYLYPEFDGEKFITEAVVWNRMAADGLKLRFYNDIICIYEYQEDGLTRAGNSLFVNNPRGYGLWLKEKCKYEKKSFVKRMKLYYAFTCELSEYYASEKIAECMGIPSILVNWLKNIHKFIQWIRK